MAADALRIVAARRAAVRSHATCSLNASYTRMRLVSCSTRLGVLVFRAPCSNTTDRFLFYRERSFESTSEPLTNVPVFLTARSLFSSRIIREICSFGEPLASRFLSFLSDEAISFRYHNSKIIISETNKRMKRFR